VITIWGRGSSSNVQKVLWCCDELGIAYEQIPVGREFGKNGESWYRTMNPNGLVPTVRDGDLILWESNSILRYLCNRYDGERLYPIAPGPRSHVDRWLDWQLSVNLPAIQPVFWGLIRTPEAERDMPAILAATAKLNQAWTLLDHELASRPYVAGDTLSIADLGLGNAVHRWYAFPIERPALTNIEAWYGRLKERPGFRKHVMTPIS
jgi:glutathione S-transferase